MTAGRVVNSQSTDWCTPPKYVRAVKRFFGGEVALDPCSNEWSVVEAGTEFRLPERNGLQEEWTHHTIYVNPPYGADRERGTTIRDWLSKCAGANKCHRSEVLALIPVATNTRHWKEFIWGRATAVCFLYDTRLRFLVEGKDEGKGAPMACAMVYWGELYEGFADVFLKFGAVVDIRPLHGKAIGERTPLRQPELFGGT